MDQLSTWQQASRATHELYRGLQPEIRQQLDTLIEEIMQIKQQLVDVVVSVGASDICRSCGGKCCLYGKYHVTVLDMLAYLSSGAAPVEPDFSSHPACPYSDADGCRMVARYRPMTCVIFNCEQIDDQLTASERQTMVTLEHRLRTTIDEASRLTGSRLNRALLLSQQEKQI